MPIIQTTKPLRPRAEWDVYPTPEATVFRALELADDYLIDAPYNILDPGAGDGVWGRVAKQFWPSSLIEGVEIRSVPWPDEYFRWYHGDFLTWQKSGPFSLVIGNPPYREAEAIVRKSYDCLKPGGVLIFLLRLAFLEGQKRSEGLWKEMPPVEVRVLPKRPSFTGNGKSDATAYAFFLWKRGFQGVPKLSWAVDANHAI